MTEAEIKANVRLALGRDEHLRLFNNPVGEAWVGQVVSHRGELLTLQHPRRVTYGLAPASTDLIGIVRYTVRPEDVGTSIGAFVALEIKRPRVSVPEHQRNFIRMIQDMGGIAGVVRSPDDAIRLLESAR